MKSRRRTRASYLWSTQKHDENGESSGGRPSDPYIWARKHPRPDGKFVTHTELKGDIRLEHVDFGYVSEKPVLYDVSPFAKPGQKIAFVGATGAGKTTITNLINRFYDIPDGKIRLRWHQYQQDSVKQTCAALRCGAAGG